jgi:hypothetical protein
MEFIGYEKTQELLIDLKADSNNFSKYLPEESLKAMNMYNKIVNEII